MRIKSITAKNVPPVKLFQTGNLSDIIIIAGPNGVGKSRLIGELLRFFQNPTGIKTFHLIVEATCKEEISTWGKNSLDTSIPSDAHLLSQTLQQNKKRGHWKSGVLNFESDRSLQQIKPFAFTWDLLDPNEEVIDWNTSFYGMKDRYQDTVHSIFKIIEHQKKSIANRAIALKNEGKTSMNLEFGDPLEPFKKAFSQLLSPKILLNPSTQNQQLEYEYEANKYNISSLSSGEKEVINIVFDFILRQPENCVVIFDEPELHLHPELSYKLIQTLKNVGENNQFLLCTHSPDIISSSLDNSVIFLAPPKTDDFNQAITVTEDDETNQALKLLGHSIGIVALGRKIVLIEGRESSLDKQVYGSLIKNKYPNLVLVPTGGKDEIKSFSNIFDKVLSKTIWGVEFFMLTDRDTLPPFKEMTAIEKKSPRLRILNKYHLENYFLDENIWANIFSTMEPNGSWLTDPKQIRMKMKGIAQSYISYAVSLSVSSLIRTMVGNVDIMPKECHNKTKDEVETLLISKATEELKRINESMPNGTIKKHSEELFAQLTKSIADDGDEWKNLIPGRPILNEFVAKANLKIGRAKQLYLKESEKSDFNIFKDILDIFADFNGQ